MWQFNSFLNKEYLVQNPLDSKFRESISVRRLNHLVKKYNFTRYLEIGVERGHTLEAIDAQYRSGVDPAPLCRVDILVENMHFYKMDSDKFFYIFEDEPFQLIFLDGLHEAKQTYRDVINAFKILSEGGVILLDDIWPTDYASSLPSIKLSTKEKNLAGIFHRRWYGDVYKVVSAINYFYTELNIQIIGNGLESHSQALIWRKNNANYIESLSEVYTYIDAISYNGVFGKNLLHKPWNKWIPDEVFYKDFSV